MICGVFGGLHLFPKVPTNPPAETSFLPSALQKTRGRTRKKETRRVKPSAKEFSMSESQATLPSEPRKTMIRSFARRWARSGFAPRRQKWFLEKRGRRISSTARVSRCFLRFFEEFVVYYIYMLFFLVFETSELLSLPWFYEA